MRNVERYEKAHGVTFTQELAALKLTEELGEFAQALIVHTRQCRPSKYMPEEASRHELASELADILGILVLNAHLHGIDLEEALKRKWLSWMETQ